MAQVKTESGFLGLVLQAVKSKKSRDMARIFISASYLSSIGEGLENVNRIMAPSESEFLREAQETAQIF